MGKYSLIVKDKENNNLKIIPVTDLKRQEKRNFVNMNDIDYWTSQFTDKYSFMEHLYNNGIIDFKTGNAYIVTHLNDNELVYKCIFKDEKINKISQNVLGGEIQRLDSDCCKDIIKKFFDLMEQSDFIPKIEATKYITQTLKDLIQKYHNIYNRTNYTAEEVEEFNNIKEEIYKCFKRYKNFRGLVLFEKEYDNIYKYQNIQKSVSVKPKPKKFKLSTKEEINKIAEKYSRSCDKQRGMTRTEAYNREYDEFLTEEEYENAYHGEDDILYRR